MKKLKISGREIRKLGIQGELSISLIKRIVACHYKQSKKEDFIAVLSDVLSNPDKYKNHEYFGDLVRSFELKPAASKESQLIYNEPIPYITFGKDEIESGAIEQMNKAMRLPITIKGALMADAHQGYGLPIGGVVATSESIIPYGVGMDIGCRMCMSVYNISTDIIKKDNARLKQILIDETRFGNDEFSKQAEHAVLERKEFREIHFLKSLQSKAYSQLGTSGHGNHFVDFGELEIIDPKNELNVLPGKYFAVLSHSGSRGMGAEIARYYTRIAKDICKLPKGFTELSWLDLNSQEGHEYWLAMNLAGDYSAANHEIIHQRLSETLAEKPLFRVENHHNFAWKEVLEDGSMAIVHRKGATPTKKGFLGIIPGSMASPAFIIRGKGNHESLNSAAHGAGRVMSRSVAKQNVTKQELQKHLENAGVILIGGNTDEAPWVYKDINKIMEYQKDLVEIVAQFTPRIVRMAK